MALVNMALVNLAYQPVWMFQDNNGIPLNGGLLYTYLAGTTTPATTWVDSLGVTPNTNPIVLNARGEVGSATATSVGIWITPGTAYKFVLTDASGSLIWTFDNYTIATGGGGGGGGGGLPQTVPENLAAVVPVNTLYQPGDVRRYGATLASADNTSAFQQALNAAQFGQEVYVPSGVWNIASVSALSALTFFTNTLVRGDGNNLSQILVTGNNVGHLFYGINTTHIVFRDVWMQGNSQATNYGQGAAIYFDSDNTIAATIGGYQVSNCRFGNFKGPYWIAFFLNSGSQEMRRIRVQNCDFISQTGNAISTGIGFSAWCIAIQGSNIGQFYASDIDISNNTCEAQFIKGLLVLWGSVIRAKVHNNIVKNAGVDSFFVDDSGCYAFISYRQAGTYGNDRIEFSGNVVDGCRDCGFYIASPLNVTVVDNDIRNQTSSANGTLPKGAIAISSAVNAIVANNRIDNCRFGISWIGVPLAGQCVIDANQITNLPTSAPAILIGTAGPSVWSSSTFYSPGNYVSSSGTNYYCIQANTNAVPASNPADWTATVAQWKSLLISNNQIQGFANSGALGIDLICSPTAGGHSLKVTGNDIDCFRYAFFLDQAASADALFDFIDISGNIVKTGNSGGVYLGATIHPYVSVRSNQFAPGGAFNNSTWHVIAVTPINVEISDNDFCNFTAGTGACIIASNPEGRFRMWNNRFQNVDNTHLADANAVNNPGYTLPNWTSNQTDLVQFLQQTEAGSGGSKYMVIGWGWDNPNNVWKQIRTLTGN